METREELLNKLQGVKTQISRLLKLMDEQTNIVASFRKSEASIATTGLKAKIYIAIASFAVAYILQSLLRGEIVAAALDAGLMYLLYRYRNKKSILKNLAVLVVGVSILVLPIHAFGLLFSGLIREALPMLFFLALGMAATVALIKIYNRRVEAKNNEIQLRNAELQEQYDVTVQRIKQHRKKLNLLIAGWYPPDYCSLEAVNFFISAISNYKVDNMMDAVNIFDDSQYKKKMLASQQAIADMNRQQIINQQAISKQLRFANMLSIVNLSLQSSTQDAICRNTDAINHARAEVVGSVNRATDAINRLRR